MSIFSSRIAEEESRSVQESDKKGGDGNGSTPQRQAMRRRRRRSSTGTASSSSGQLLGLSLFVMLLAFFIVLNAISSFEETKVRPIMESLGYTFAARMAQEHFDDHPSMRQAEEASLDEGETVDRIKTLFSAQLPAHEAVISHRKGTIHVRVPFKDFETAVMAMGQRNALGQAQANAKFLSGFFLPTLVALVKTDEVSAPYRMDMLLNISDNPARLQNQQPKQMTAIVQSMSRVAEKIEAAGLPAKLISTGLQEGEQGMVELLFRPHVPYSPLGNANE